MGTAFVINAGFLAATVGFMIGMGNSGTFRGPSAKNSETTVEIVLGINDTQSSGDPPSISLWNNYGEPIARWSPYRAGHLWPANGAGPGMTRRAEPIKAGETWSVDIAHGDSVTQTRWWPPKHGETTGYVLLSASEDQNCNGQNDGICVSAVMVSDVNSQTVMFGDIPAQCGAAWYWGSQTIRFQSTEYVSKCFWLDYDGSVGEKSSRSVSFHINSMKGSPDRAAQYSREGWGWICGSTPRFAYWSNLRPHSWIPFFDPPLEFEIDRQNGSPFGLDKDPSRIVDKEPYIRHEDRWNPPGMENPYTDYPGRDNYDPCRTAKHRRRRQLQPEAKPKRLIISPKPEHSGSELCQSPSSRGPDFVSLDEGIFCDMDTKTAFPICDARQEIKTECFDLGTNSLLLTSPMRRGEAPKVYDSVDHW